MLLITILAAAASLSVSAATLTHKAPDNLPVQNPTWRGPIFVNGPDVILNGTMESILAQIKTLNPNWKAEDFHNHTSKRDLNNIEARSNRVSYQCNIDRWGTAGIGAIGAGIQSIDSFPGYCGQAANSCGRFSCSWDSAIVMCNTNNVDIGIPCSLIGQNAHFILDACANYGTGQVNGQAFYINPNYNVIVKHTDPGRDC